ncbi:MAG: helix-turn-helix transcriptional regulator [Anaerolineae bacterium]|nr:helix-turn-helix transcriptional regulator [Anaerolineae bacterium]
MAGNSQLTFFDICDSTISFGELLDDLLHARKMTGKEFAQRINYSPPFVVRLLRNQLPHWMGLQMVETIAAELNCDSVEHARLVMAFGCTVLRSKGMIA